MTYELLTAYRTAQFQYHRLGNCVKVLEDSAKANPGNATIREAAAYWRGRYDTFQHNIQTNQHFLAIRKWIEEIEDEGTRKIFRLAFTSALSWETVAGLIGNGQTAGALEEAARKYVEDHDDGRDPVPEA